jgi:biotin carboxylase
MTDRERHMLITGAGTGGYVLVRALRPHARMVGLVTEADQPSVAARSRYVDYHERLAAQPSPDSRHATDGDASYARAVLAVAKRRGATHVVPVKDRDVLALTAAAADLAAQGVTLCCADAAVAHRVLDKSAVLSAARAYGVDVPRSLSLPRSNGRAPSTVNPFGYPVIVKARRSWGAAGVRLATDAATLDAAVTDLTTPQGRPSLQEYVRGDVEPSLTAFVGGAGSVLVQVWLRKLRYAGPSHSCCVVTTAPPPEAGRVAAFLAGTGLRGPVGVQLKRCADTGRLVLIEVNPRLGQNARIVVRLCERLNIDLGTTLLNCFENTSPERPQPTIAAPGLVGVSLPEDPISLVRFLTAGRRAALRADNPRPSVAAYLRSYVDVYRRRPVVDIVSGSLRDDPVFAVRALCELVPYLMREHYRFVPYGDVGLLRSAGKER